MAGVLSPLGFAVREAAGGVEALAHCAQERPGLAIMDLLMPGMDGFETIRRLRAAHGREFPILALSASVGAEVRQRALEAGADAFLGKPFKDDEVLGLLAQLLDRTPAPNRETPAASPPDVAENPGAPDTCDVGLLPADLRTELRRASVAADQAKLVELARRAGGIAPALGRQLLNLIERYDLDLLQALLGEDDSDEAGDAGAG